MTFPIYGKIKNGNQTTNQLVSWALQKVEMCRWHRIAPHVSAGSDAAAPGGGVHVLRRPGVQKVEPHGFHRVFPMKNVDLPVKIHQFCHRTSRGWVKMMAPLVPEVSHAAVLPILLGCLVGVVWWPYGNGGPKKNPPTTCMTQNKPNESKYWVHGACGWRILGLVGL